jgi:hypothetical protein
VTKLPEGPGLDAGGTSRQSGTCGAVGPVVSSWARRLRGGRRRAAVLLQPRTMIDRPLDHPRPARQTVDAQNLFTHTLSDLEKRIESTDEYDVLMAAALLRKLLVDGERLMDQVNRPYRLKLRFHISDVSPFEKLIYEDGPVIWAIEDALDPESPLAYQPYDATRDQFLGRRIMRFNGHWITVGDVIDQLANVEGAVHSGEPDTAHRKAVQALGKFYSRDGLPGVVREVKLIGRIIVRGLSPLRDAVIAAG